MSTKQIHYNIDNIDKEAADYNLIYGEKSNGKSYQVKHKKAVEHYLKTGKRFILLRRWKEDITNLWIEQYFADVDVLKLTDNKYNCITCYRKVLYLSIYNEETGKTTRFDKIGYVMSLSTEQHMSSASFLDVDIIIFEEFMERGIYLPHEPDRLMIFYSTIDRKRGTTKLYMVGNSISRVCPYINDWGLSDIFKKLNQGQIATKIIENEENKVKIAIEFCQSSGGKTMAIGNSSNMIDKGSWQSFPQPHLPKSYNSYKVLYRFGFQYQSFKFLCELLVDKETKRDTAWFIYPYNKEFEDKMIIFSDVIKISKYWQRDIYNISIKNDKLRNLFNTFKENRIFYSSDMCRNRFQTSYRLSNKKIGGKIMNSKIILVKDINIDKDYNNVLSYSENDMLTLCQSQSHLVAQANTYSFIRNKGTINVDFTYSQCLQANYLAFQNPDYSNKWFFAWIDDVMYKGENCTEISFTIDAWSTWYDKWSTKKCFVNRHHVNNDAIGINTIPENLDVGEVIEEQETEDASYGNQFGYWVGVLSNWKIKDGSTGEEVLPSNKGSQYSGITVYDNTVFGNQLFLFHITQLSDFTNLYLFISRTNYDGHIDDIQNIFIIPDVAITVSQLTSHTAKLIDNTFTFYTMAFDLTPETFNTTITKRHSFTGFSPKNNKCYVYPYNYLFVSNNQGSNNIYKYEDFNSTNCVFENQFSLSVGGSGRVVPKNYKGMAKNEDEALALGKYPTCAWSSDAFTNWLTQNSVNMASSVALTAGTIASTIATGGATLPLAIGSIATISSTIAGGIGKFNQASLLPNLSGGQATGDIIWAINKNMFTFREMRVKNEYLKIIDDYFTRFRIRNKIFRNT